DRPNRGYHGTRLRWPAGDGWRAPANPAPRVCSGSGGPSIPGRAAGRRAAPEKSRGIRARGSCLSSPFLCYSTTKGTGLTSARICGSLMPDKLVTLESSSDLKGAAFGCIGGQPFGADHLPHAAQIYGVTAFAVEGDDVFDRTTKVRFPFRRKEHAA